jgi:hypothetical protein
MIINLLQKLLLFIIEFFHFIFLYIPIAIYFGFIKSDFVLKSIFIIILITPLHWIFFDNKCILTILGNKLNNSSDNKTYFQRNFPFIWSYCSGFFKMSSKDFVSKFILIVIMINIILLWYFIFFTNRCILKNYK